jgi:hypothetical protein
MKLDRPDLFGRRQFLDAAGVAALGNRALAGQPQAEAGKPLRVGLIGVGARGTFQGTNVQQIAKDGNPSNWRLSVTFISLGSSGRRCASKPRAMLPPKPC